MTITFENAIAAFALMLIGGGFAILLMLTLAPRRPIPYPMNVSHIARAVCPFEETNVHCPVLCRGCLHRAARVIAVLSAPDLGPEDENPLWMLEHSAISK